MKKAVINNWKKIALALAILIMLNVFFNVGVETFVGTPEYNDVCDGKGWYEDQIACEEVGGEWTGSWCEYDCWSTYEEVVQPYSRLSFIALVSLGTAVLLLGLLVQMPMAVANGLLYGGVVSIWIGVARYWGYMDDYLQFIVSGVVLAILILVGFKKMQD